VEAVILILKHATLLRLSNSSPQSALAHAELAYREANIDLKIQQHLASSSQMDFVKPSEVFIKATDIGSFIHPPVNIISHQAFSAYLNLRSKTMCIEKTIGFFGNQHSRASLSPCRIRGTPQGRRSKSNVETSRNCVVEP